MLDDEGVGYCSDITRCVHIGEPPAEVAEAYAVLHDGAAGRGGRRGGRHAVRGGRRRRPRRHRRGRLRRPLHPPHRPRHRGRGARGPVHRRRQRHAARPGPRLLDRAGHLRARPLRACASRTSWWRPPTAPTRSTAPTTASPSSTAERTTAASGIPGGRAAAPLPSHAVIRLDAATVLLQWAVGGLLFLWVTTRGREVGIGYGWLVRGIYILMAARRVRGRRVASTRCRCARRRRWRSWWRRSGGAGRVDRAPQGRGGGGAGAGRAAVGPGGGHDRASTAGPTGPTPSGPSSRPRST